MINNSLNDATQMCLMPHIENTEFLLNKVLRNLDSANGYGEITVLPDLGISANSTRMNGGFFTGMYIKWNCKIPFIPIDTTVNSCGVSIYILDDIISVAEFKNSLSQVKRKFTNVGFNWNFERGNHFIIHGLTDNGQPCMIMHASADEYKHKNSDMALYPSDNVWYKDSINVINENFGGCKRYLRYIYGSPAEKFISIASKLKEVNEKRTDIAAEYLFGNRLKEKYIYTPHYGMPDESSVAIGCSWTNNKYVLLSSNGSDIFIVKQKETNKSNVSLNPHGFGVELKEPNVFFSKNGRLHICGKTINNDEDIKSLKCRTVRHSNADKDTVLRYTTKILGKCPGKIETTIHPIFTLSADGVKQYIPDLVI